MNLTLYAHPDVPQAPVDSPWSPEEGGAALAQVFLEKAGSYHYGAMTAYLLRAFGLPNAFAYNSHKHGHTWALDTGDQMVVRIEPRPLELSAQEVQEDFEAAVLLLARSHTFTLYGLSPSPAGLTRRWLETLVQELLRPTCMRDVTCDALGSRYSRTRGFSLAQAGPGAPELRVDGQRSANLVVLPEAHAERLADALEILDAAAVRPYEF